MKGKAKQSLQKFIDYPFEIGSHEPYTSFNEFLADAALYNGRILKICQNNRGYNQDKRTRRLIRLGQEIGHLPYTYLGKGNDKRSDNEQTKLRLQQYLPKKFAHEYSRN